MSGHAITNTEKELNFFITRIVADGILQTAEIREIDMDGWVMFECFLHPAQTVVHLSWDEDAHEPEWIDMEDDAPMEYASQLCEAIQRFKSKTVAA